MDLELNKELGNNWGIFDVLDLHLQIYYEKIAYPLDVREDLERERT